MNVRLCSDGARVKTMRKLIKCEARNRRNVINKLKEVYFYFTVCWICYCIWWGSRLVFIQFCFWLNLKTNFFFFFLNSQCMFTFSHKIIRLLWENFNDFFFRYGRAILLQFYFQQVDNLIVFQCLINLTVKMRSGLRLRTFYDSHELFLPLSGFFSQCATRKITLRFLLDRYS